MIKENEGNLLVVEGLGSTGELLKTSPECGHRLPDLVHLVLRNSMLDMREDEFVIERGGFFVVGGSSFEFLADKVDCGATRS